MTEHRMSEREQEVLRMEMEQYSNDQLKQEIGAALDRVGKFRDSVTRKHLSLNREAQAPVCMGCGDALSCPIFSCSLRKHHFCLSCITKLGGKHTCMVCSPSCSVAHSSSIHTSALLKSGPPADLVVLRERQTFQPIRDGLRVAEINSVVDPGQRNLLLEQQLSQKM